MHNELKAHHKDDGDLQNQHLLSPAAADFKLYKSHTLDIFLPIIHNKNMHVCMIHYKHNHSKNLYNNKSYGYTMIEMA